MGKSWAVKAIVHNMCDGGGGGGGDNDEQGCQRTQPPLLLHV